MAAACTQPEPNAAPMPASSVFSADAGVGLSFVGDTEGSPPIAKQPEPGVIKEILAAAPKKRPTTTDPDGGTLIGSETGMSGDETGENALGSKGSPNTGRTHKSVLVESGMVEVQGLPAHAAERTARAQFYHPLTMRCRDAQGNILPPDAVVLGFRVDEDGNIVPSSISAVASDPKYESAANCMRRELSGVAFHGPAASRGAPTSFHATIPSVD